MRKWIEWPLWGLSVLQCRHPRVRACLQQGWSRGLGWLELSLTRIMCFQKSPTPVPVWSDGSFICRSSEGPRSTQELSRSPGLKEQGKSHPGQKPGATLPCCGSEMAPKAHALNPASSLWHCSEGCRALRKCGLSGKWSLEAIYNVPFPACTPRPGCSSRVSPPQRMALS